MTKSYFISDDFLLETEYARELYHKYAKPAPIIDFHCHLPPDQAAEDHRFANLTEIWLAGDHYKWRAMRANGVAERYCTGDADAWEKFEQWAATVPKLLRNPAYHWTHLELKHPFGIADRLLCPDTARDIWEACNAMLADPAYSARGIMKQMHVALVCTTDDPTDSLEAHRQAAEDPDFSIQMLPTWRPDKALNVDQPDQFNAWIRRLEAASDVECDSFDALLEALRIRARHFAERGCKIADHGLETPYAEDCTMSEARAAFLEARAGKRPNLENGLKYKSAMMYELGIINHEMNWAQQLHIGPIRNTNTRMFALLGPDSGFDSIGDAPLARPLAKFLDRLDQTNQLSRTVLYPINPADNMAMATMAGNFQEGPTPSKIQLGSGWWFNDQLDGMRQQIDALSQTGLLSRFVGMVTDSRSFLSYPRHEYFRRLLCNIFGNDMARGLLPLCIEQTGHIVQDICYHNAVNYFGFDMTLKQGENNQSNKQS